MRGAADPVVAWFRRPDVELSAHFVVAPDGEVIAMVPEDRRAWHAGAGRWGPWDDVNSASIGIELCNDGASPFAAPQMDALEGLLPVLMARHGIPAEGVIAHSDLAPGRKIDPGPRFDWRRLARADLSIWPEAGRLPVDPVRFARDASRFGYATDVPPEARLAAMRLRFRPAASGPLSPADMAVMADLARRWPVDAARAQV